MVCKTPNQDDLNYGNCQSLNATVVLWSPISHSAAWMWKICRVTAPWRLGDWVGWVPFGDDWMIGQSFLVWVLKIGPGNPQSIALLCISPPEMWAHVWQDRLGALKENGGEDLG